LFKTYLSNLKTDESSFKKWEATKATNVVTRCIITSDDTEPENYGLGENQTPDLCHCRYNKKTT